MGKQRRDLLLINPWVYDFAAYDLWAKPLGLLALAALLERNEWKINYVDCLDIHHPAMKALMRTQPKRRPDHRGHFYQEEVSKPAPLRDIPRRFHRFGIPPKVFSETIRSLPAPQAILITSGMTYWYLGLHEVIGLVKEIFPSVPVIAGGVYATLCQGHAELLSGADFIVRGCGEIQVLRLLEELTGVSPSFVPDAHDPTSLPYSAFHLYPFLEYVCILTSRGCPFQCTYCASPLINPEFLKRDPAQVIEEIAHWTSSYGVEDIAFYDDALLMDRQHTLALLQGIAARGIRARFHTPNGLHAQGITQDEAILMRHVGFRTIRLGLETSSPERQQATGGKVSNQEFSEAVRRLRHAGYSSQEIGTYILVGLPGQRREEVEETIRFVLDSGARPYLAEYSPLPGTPLWEDAVRSSPFDLVKEPLFHNNSILPCRWEGLTWEDLRSLKDIVRQGVRCKLPLQP